MSRQFDVICRGGIAVDIAFRGPNGLCSSMEPTLLQGSPLSFTVENQPLSRIRLPDMVDAKVRTFNHFPTTRTAGSRATANFRLTTPRSPNARR